MMIGQIKKEFKLVYLMFFIVLFIFSCERPGEDVQIPTGPVATVEYLVEEGWELYEAGKYRDAADYFETAINRDAFYKEAYLGSGWALNRLFNYDNAILRYDLLLALVSESDIEFEILSYAGKAVAYAGLNSDFLSAQQAELFIKIALELVETTEDDYIFAHDSWVSTDNLKVLLVNEYWNYQDYYSVQNAIIDYFDGDLLSDLISNGENFERKLDIPAKITVEIEVDTTVVPNDTSITSGKIELDKNYNLIEVDQILDSLNSSIVYPIKSFSHGGNIIYIDVGKMDDISMLLDDLTQAVEVDFINTKDYGKYLNILLEKIKLL
jgi:tetratricopeptide (TPR) repeat protein